jgi:tRNA pseudouridine32 synthase/23S rRNA pseudouridine746 synthase
MSSLYSKVHRFKTDISSLGLPEKFTFPFYYTPHPLAVTAAEQLMHYLETQQDFVHNFGMKQDGDNGLEIGKMFGVLVVKDKEGQLGYIAAFSGKLADSNTHAYFVPPVYDLLDENDFFIPEIKKLNAINDEVERLEQDPELERLRQQKADVIAACEKKMAGFKQYCDKQKELRQKVRDSFEPYKDDANYALWFDYLNKQSARDNYEVKQLQKIIKEETAAADAALAEYEDKLNDLKQQRKEMSAALQDRIFQQYTFLNRDKVHKSLYEIFNHDLGIQPLAGAGECAAPKLFQYAFMHDLEPVCMAEFWWGKSPKSEIRKHKHYYPACRGKCEPILKHMLAGINMDEDVLRIMTPMDCNVEIVYEDEYLAVVNKPHGFLSVPGKFMEDSVYKRMFQKYPQATGPLIVHRLDMATSGLMLIAKDKYTHELLQRQFIKKTIQKRYEAILEGELPTDSGSVNLPLRLDLDDRPRQLVCYEYGKNAFTKYEVVARVNGKTRVNLWPITGRTHQLRVHMSHPEGLNTPILGDEFYGKKADRLYLHAAELTFIHPNTRETMTVYCPAPF